MATKLVPVKPEERSDYDRGWAAAIERYVRQHEENKAALRAERYVVHIRCFLCGLGALAILIVAFMFRTSPETDMPDTGRIWTFFLGMAFCFSLHHLGKMLSYWDWS